MTDWSDAPVVTRSGSRFEPRQPISPQRRADIADSLRAMNRSHLTDADREQLYLEWLAERATP